MSRCNPDEVKFTLALVKCIKQICCDEKSFRSLIGKIAIITPYKAQVTSLKNAFGPWLRSINCQLSDVEINTVDAF
jgi:superfamily I DNA and/or RNA helicase